ncbi:MAG: RICIN domain-containing protein [Kofleriaceae bacterium]
MRTTYLSLFAILSTTACVEDSLIDDAPESELVVQSINGSNSSLIAGIVRVRRANDAAVHTGIMIGNVSTSSLILTSERWASWESPGSVTVGVPVAGGGITQRPAVFVNNTAFFPGAVLQIGAVASNQFSTDALAPAQLVNTFARCYQYVSDTQLQYVDVRIASANGDDLAFTYPWGGTLADGDAGAPCIRDGSYFVGFVTAANAAGGTLQHAGSMAPWLDGMRNLAGVRDDSRSAMLAIHTRPNATARMCLDVPWGSPFSQTAVNQFACHNGPAQRWWFDYRVDSVYPRLVNDSSGLCLDVAGASTASGADFQVYPCHSGLNQRLDMTLWADNSIKLRPRSALLNCISVQGGPSTSSLRVEQRTCAAAPGATSDQRWFFHYNPPYTP